MYESKDIFSLTKSISEQKLSTREIFINDFLLSIHTVNNILYPAYTNLKEPILTTRFEIININPEKLIQYRLPKP